MASTPESIKAEKDQGLGAEVKVRTTKEMVAIETGKEKQMTAILVPLVIIHVIALIHNTAAGALRVIHTGMGPQRTGILQERVKARGQEGVGAQVKEERNTNKK